MSKFLNKYFRKLHRWLVLPFVVIFITLILAKQTSAGDAVQKAQQIMVVVFLITGVYLFLLPYWTKWQRQRRHKVKASK